MQGPERIDPRLMNGYVKSGETISPDQRPEYAHVRDASIRGTGVGVAAFLAKTVLRFGSIAVLARLLTPADFGLVAMAGTLLNLFLIVADWGLLMASTQGRHVNEDQLSTLFWINVGGSLLLALLTIVLSPLLVLIFDESRIISAAVALSPILVAIGVGAQHDAIMRRRLSYGFLHMIGVMSQAAGLIVGIVLAVSGLGFWSLIWQQVVAHVAHTMLLWGGTRWRPGKPVIRVDVVQFLKYGSRLVPAQLLSHMSRNIVGIVIGAAVGATELGLYQRAYGIVMNVEQLKQPLKTMVPASLSRLQDNTEEFSRYYVLALTMWSLVGCGVIGLVTAEAPAIVTLMLGDQWLSVIPLVRWLAPAGLVSGIGVATEWMLMPLGYMKRLVALRALRLCSIVIGSLLGWRWGVVGVAAGFSIASSISLVIELFFVTAGKRVSVHSLAGAFIRPTLATISAASVVFLVSTEVSVVAFLLESLLYVVVFLIVHSALPGGWPLLRRALHAILRATRVEPIN